MTDETTNIKQGADMPDGQFSSGMELLSKSLKTVFFILTVCISLMIAFFLIAGGSFKVDTTKEVIIVLHFGKATGPYTAGWHWFLPYPVNQKISIPKGHQTIDVRTFMPGSDKGTLAPGRDGYTLTGDNNIIHSDWKMVYRIKDPMQFFKSVIFPGTPLYPQAFAAEQETLEMRLYGASMILKNLLEESIVTASAGLDVESVYYQKTPFLHKVRTILEEKISNMNIGISVEDLSLRVVSPPVQTIAYFQMLQLAAVMAAKEKEEANADAITMVNEAHSRAAAIKADAAAYRKRVVSEVEADAGYFKQILEEWRKNKKATYISLYSRVLADAIAGAQERFVINTNPEKEQQIRIKLNSEPEIKKDTPAGTQKGGGK